MTSTKPVKPSSVTLTHTFTASDSQRQQASVVTFEGLQRTSELIISIGESCHAAARTLGF
jgi:hypothetical protein